MATCGPLPVGGFLHHLLQPENLEAIGRASEAFLTRFDGHLQRVQDELLDADLVNSMQDLPGGLNETLLKELFGIAGELLKNNDSKQEPKEDEQKPAEKPESKGKEPAVRPKKTSAPKKAQKKQEDEFLKDQSGSSKETLEDVRARLLSNACRASAAECPLQKSEKASAGGEEGKAAPAPQTVEQEQKAEPMSVVEDTNTVQKVIKDRSVEWRLAAESWWRPEDVEVNVKNSEVAIQVAREMAQGGAEFSATKQFQVKIRLPEDVDGDKLAASFDTDVMQLVVSAPRIVPTEPSDSDMVPLHINRV